MANIPKIEYSQSTDGKILTLIDATEYDSPIGNYTRTVELWSSINGSGTLIATLAFTGTNTTVQYSLASDRYISAKLIFVGSPTITPVYVNFVTTQYEWNALYNLNGAKCGCVKAGSCDAKFNGFIDLYTSQVATQAGNSGLANTLINSSYKWLTK